MLDKILYEVENDMLNNIKKKNKIPSFAMAIQKLQSQNVMFHLLLGFDHYLATDNSSTFKLQFESQKNRLGYMYFSLPNTINHIQ
jgi:hypothetical protein